MAEECFESSGSGAADVTRIWVCSSNAGKLRDFAFAAQSSAKTKMALAALPGLEQIQAPEENGISFEQNAITKAIYYSNYTSEPVLADDSGLEVDALQGEPGVRSARYAGIGATDAENNNLLLSKLVNVKRREACFVCWLALAQKGQLLLTATGSVAGSILEGPRGHGGFGYDPLFYYSPLQRSFSELRPEEKLSVSHRGKALVSLFEQLSER